MGYSTDFEGHFDLDKPLTEAHAEYLVLFGGTRRMKRDEAITATRPDPVRKAVGLPVGAQGEYFVGEGGPFGQVLGLGGRGQGQGVLDNNSSPETQPGLWCQWVPTEDHKGIIWDGSEKFYGYIAWLEYIIENFLRRWGYTLSGEVAWRGEETHDTGTIYVLMNRVQTHPFSALVKLAETAK